MRASSFDISSSAPGMSSSSSSYAKHPPRGTPPPPRDSAIADYERYLRLPELSDLCTSRLFPEWHAEPILKPALQALEVTFRLLSLALSDPRPYSDQPLWARRLESLSARQIELLSALFCLQDHRSSVPLADLDPPTGQIIKSSQDEVWRKHLNGGNATVMISSHTSEESLLPRLAAWDKSEAAASKIQFHIECHMRDCPFTLGLGEPNLAGKPCLQYDLVVQPSRLHSLKRVPIDLKDNVHQENQTLFAIHHILELWLCASQHLLSRIGDRINNNLLLGEAASDCWLLERVWKLLAEVEDLHLLMDPDDLLRLLKSQLAIRATTDDEALCFRSRALMAVTDGFKDQLKHKVPQVLGVEADPNGGPRVQEAAMRLFHSRKRGEAPGTADRLHLLQAFQAVEAAVKKFFFGYRQLIVAAMGTLEANRAIGASDSLTQMFTDPPYFPSLDAAKTFLGALWQRESAVMMTK